MTSSATSSPAVRDVEMEVSYVGGVPGQDHVSGELTRCEPEGEIRDVVQLELGVDPAGTRHRVRKGNSRRSGDPRVEGGVGL